MMYWGFEAMPVLVKLGTHTERALFVGTQTSREAAERSSGRFEKLTRFSARTEKEDAQAEEISQHEAYVDVAHDNEN